MNDDLRKNVKGVFSDLTDVFLATINNQQSYLQSVKEMGLLQEDLFEDVKNTSYAMIEYFFNQKNENVEENILKHTQHIAESLVLISLTYHPRLYIENVYSTENLKQIKLLRDICFEFIQLTYIQSEETPSDSNTNVQNHQKLNEQQKEYLSSININEINENTTKFLIQQLGECLKNKSKISTSN